MVTIYYKTLFPSNNNDTSQFLLDLKFDEHNEGYTQLEQNSKNLYAEYFRAMKSIESIYDQYNNIFSTEQINKVFKTSIHLDKKRGTLILYGSKVAIQCFVQKIESTHNMNMRNKKIPYPLMQATLSNYDFTICEHKYSNVTFLGTLLPSLSLSFSNNYDANKVYSKLNSTPVNVKLEISNTNGTCQIESDLENGTMELIYKQFDELTFEQLVERFINIFEGE